MSYDDREYSEDYYKEVNELCEYCGDKPPSWDGKYCGGYCHYRDTQIVPSKQAMIKRIVEIQAEARKTDPDFSVLKSVKEARKTDPDWAVLKSLSISKGTSRIGCEEHNDIKIGDKRKYCCVENREM